MPWPIAIADMRVRVGLAGTDASRDADILMTQDVALSIVEDYLGRWLMHGQYEEHLHWHNSSFQARAFPIDPTKKITFKFDGQAREVDPTNDKDTEIDYESGIIYSPSTPASRVKYTGGYVTLPPPLLWALGRVFDAYWESDAITGGSGVSGSSAGGIKRVSIVGVGSVDFGGGSSAAGAAGGGSGPWSLISDVVVSILDRYRLLLV